MNTLSTPRKINVAALVVAAGGLLILFVSVPDHFPTVPPGPIILLVAASLVAFAPGRWTPLVGVVVPLAIFVGGLMTGAPDLLIHPDNVGAVVGSAIQTTALITAIAAGTIALLGDAPASARLA